MIVLDVPFKEKDLAKNLGARWNPSIKKWYVQEGVDLSIFASWLPEDVQADLANQIFTTDTQDDIESNLQSLSYFLAKVSVAVSKAMPSSEWIVAEISELTMNNGHCFLTICEHNKQGSLIARAKATIFKSNAQAVLSKFQEVSIAKLEPGMKVLIQAKAEFHAQYGLSLIVEDIDPKFTLGDMAAKIAKILDILTKENIINNNKRLPKPKEFTKIAVISPESAAGLGDFREEADLLEQYNLCNFYYYSAVFQGVNSKESILQAIAEVADANLQHNFDAMVIIRGGGAVSDLAWLNEEEIARAVCMCKLCVMVGIGHQRDYTVLDDVAGIKFDTPSKVINYIFSIIVDNAQTAANNYQEITNQGFKILDKVKSNIELLNLNIKQRAQAVLSQTKIILTNLLSTVQDSTIYSIKNVKQNLESLLREILGQSPTKVLQKGFVISRTANSQKILTSKHQALASKDLELEYQDGKIKVTTVLE